MSEKNSDTENVGVPAPEGQEPEEGTDADSEQLQGAIEKLSEHKPEVASEFMAMMGTGPMQSPSSKDGRLPHYSVIGACCRS